MTKTFTGVTHFLEIGHATDETLVLSDLKPRQKIISGYKKYWIELQIRLAIVKTVFRNYKNLSRTYKVIRSLTKLRREMLGNKQIKKVAQVDGQYYWDLYAPGSGSSAFDGYITGEANRALTLDKNANRFTNVFVAITNTCPLRCEHCFEGDSLNSGDTLTLHDIQQIVRKFQDMGTAQIQLTGGEPMLRLPDILETLRSAKSGTDFWVLTSGYNLTMENSKKLKAAGLTGIVISLDHFDAETHNIFRGYKKSYTWAARAIKNSINANLVTALSICVTRSFVTEANLMAYAILAKTMGVSFIQMLEPKATGNYKNQDVTLTHEQEKILEDFYLKMNFDSQFSDFPIITYHGYYQRRLGCFGSGNRNVYIDTHGYLQACPFCNKKKGQVLSGDFDTNLRALTDDGCPSYSSSHTSILRPLQTQRETINNVEV